MERRNVTGLVSAAVLTCLSPWGDPAGEVLLTEGYAAGTGNYMVRLTIYRNRRGSRTDWYRLPEVPKDVAV